MWLFSINLGKITSFQFDPDALLDVKKSSRLYFPGDLLFPMLNRNINYLNPDTSSLNIASLKAHNAPQNDVTSAINSARLQEDEALPVKLEMKRREWKRSHVVFLQLRRPPRLSQLGFFSPSLFCFKSPPIPPRAGGWPVMAQPADLKFGFVVEAEIEV